jgi:hypothetical protein
MYHLYVKIVPCSHVIKNIMSCAVFLGEIASQSASAFHQHLEDNLVRSLLAAQIKLQRTLPTRPLYYVLGPHRLLSRFGGDARV